MSVPRRFRHYENKMAIKLALLAVLILAIGYWLRGHDLLTGVALSLLLLIVVAQSGDGHSCSPSRWRTAEQRRHPIIGQADAASAGWATAGIIGGGERWHMNQPLS